MIIFMSKKINNFFELNKKFFELNTVELERNPLS